MADDPSLPRIDGESDADYQIRVDAAIAVKAANAPAPPQLTQAPPVVVSPAVVTQNRRAGGGMSGTAATAGKAAASSGASTLGVILLNSYMARHHMEPMGVDESLAIGGLCTSVIHVTIAILAAIGNKIAQRLGLAVTFPVHLNGGSPPDTSEQKV